MDLQGRIALITGGTQGIGRATLLCFATDRAKVAFCAREEKPGRELEREILISNGQAMFFPADIASEPAVAEMVRTIEGKWGTIDILINNAGLLGPMSLIEAYPPSDWEEMVRVNVLGTFLVTRFVLPLMRKQDFGRIIFMTSSLGRQGRSRWGGYVASKFAIEGLMKTLAEETLGSGIRVMALNPEATRTGMRAAAYPSEDPLRLKEPSEVADVLRYLVRKDDPSLHGRSIDFTQARSMMNALGE